MSLSLYRKYRPETFDAVLGQDHVVHALQSALKSGNLSHAYLFAGSRGTGKTSIARIFARELGTSPSDIYEIDAASNNSVDQIRELVEGVSTLPFDSKYKVYILDEVHMLSKSAFNALLKTLEEPPAHVIFILATTELHKVLDTVKSRCQVFEFKKPTVEILIKMLKEGTQKEKIKINDEAIDLIARYGDESYRDTWGVLENVAGIFPNKEIQVDDIISLVGAPHREFIISFVTALVDNKLDTALELVNKVYKQGDSVDLFMEGVLSLLRLTLLYRFAPSFAQTIGEEFRDDLRANAEKWASEKNVINSELLAEFLKLLGEVKKSSIPVIPVELALIRILGNNEPQKAL